MIIKKYHTCLKVPNKKTKYDILGKEKTISIYIYIYIILKFKNIW
jgi:hypothetical protein